MGSIGSMGSIAMWRSAILMLTVLTVRTIERYELYEISTILILPIRVPYVPLNQTDTPHTYHTYDRTVLYTSDLQVLLTAGAALDLKSEKAKPSEWIPDAVWLNCIALSRALPQRFSDLPDQLSRFGAEWKLWYDHDAPETQKVPQLTLPPTTSFDHLLVVRCVRDDRMLLCAQDYIANTVGQKFIDSRPLDLREVEEEASCRCPIVAILSQGSDPTGIILELARKMKKPVRSISLGQGQEPAARKLIQTAVTQGSWVMLQNCHLGLKFMVEIEQMIVRLEDVHDEFQLWVTTEPHPRFPISLLQMSIKITNEAPAGVRAGLKSSYAWINQDLLDGVTQPQWKSMLYALCFMHTIVQERRKFGPLGFNIPYEFNQSDLSACVHFMQTHLSTQETKKRQIDWDTLNYMICDVQYGGRITDDWDRRLFNTYGQAWLAPIILDANFRCARRLLLASHPSPHMTHPMAHPMTHPMRQPVRQPMKHSPSPASPFPP